MRGGCKSRGRRTVGAQSGALKLRPRIFYDRRFWGSRVRKCSRIAASCGFGCSEVALSLTSWL
ncbi:MAG: hypothetical protein EBS01_13380 [Verrucomicrobia bacterium]|nr:hypothetical protein [Verrucomicrobiota bacterium]